MTLPEFIAIFTLRRKLIFTLFFGALLFSLAVYRLQPKSYDASLLLSISRTSTQETGEYRFDQWYRLQADERFADTLVRYFGTDEARRSLSQEAGLGQSEQSFFLHQKIKATRLSSQLIEIHLLTRTERGAEHVGSAVVTLANRYAEELNRKPNDENWFVVIGTPALIKDARFSWQTVLLIGAILGALAAFWMALFDHALSTDARQLRLTDQTTRPHENRY